jgi:nucleoside-triphosphatase
MIKNIFITGLPACGKTTLIKEILKELKIPAKGFLTEEIRREGERIGFKIVTLSGKEGILAKKGFKSSFKVSKYGVILRDLEEIGIKEIEEGLKGDFLIIVDEIGKMELFSEKFKEVILKALDSKNKILGTIMFTPYRIHSGAGLKPNPFCDKIKERKDTKIFYLTRENFQKVKEEIKELFKNNIHANYNR